MEKQLTNGDYIKIINKRFNQIGTSYTKSKTMAFMADGETQELEEPDGTFTSMNFAFKMIMDLPGKYLVLMDRPQAIRFVRVVKQRILKSLNNDIDFINLHLSKDERKAFIGKINEVFIQKLKNRIRDIIDKHNITDEDLINDNPEILKRYIVPKNELPYVPDELAHDDSSNDEYKVSTHQSNNIEKDIENFQVEMDFLDDEDKAKYTEEDTEEIVRSIVRLKNEFLSHFTYEVNHFFEQTYKEELEELINKSIKYYTERLGDIRKEGRFSGSRGFQKYNKKKFGVRREQEQERKLKYDAKRRNLPIVLNRPMPRTRKKLANAPTATANAPTVPVLNAPKKMPIPRTRKKLTNVPLTNSPLTNAPTALVLNAPKKIPIPRTRKKLTNNPIALPNANAPKKRPTVPKPRTRKLKSKLNEANVKGPNVKGPNVKGPNVKGPNVTVTNVKVPTAKVMPKPRTRQSRRKFNQPNTSL